MVVVIGSMLPYHAMFAYYAMPCHAMPCHGQVDNWTPDLVEIEAKEKEKAGCLLFVIDATTRALASILEAAEYVCRGRHVVLCIRDVTTGTSFGDELQVTESELKDLNRYQY